MHTTLRALVALTALVSGACVAQPYERARNTVYRMETGIGQCTATAVGPHVILTAEHCGVSLPGRILLDGQAADVEKIVRDGRDHVLVRVSITFKTWAQFGPKPKPGDGVFLIGNPENLIDILRLGYYAGQTDWLSPEATEPSPTDLYDIEAGHGDSGAAIFNRRGQIIGVLTGGYTPTPDFRVIRIIPWDFTVADLRDVQK